MTLLMTTGSLTIAAGAVIFLVITLIRVRCWRPKQNWYRQEM